MARLFATSEYDDLKFRMAPQDLRTLLIGERNMAPLSMQMVRWIELTEIMGFFDPSLLGGNAGPEFRIIVGPAKDTGRFQVVDFRVGAGEVAKPFEILSVSEGLAQSDASGPADKEE